MIENAMRYQICSTKEVRERIRAFSRYYALLRTYIERSNLRSSLDRGAFTHPSQILTRDQLALLGNKRHRISLGYGPEAGEPLLREKIAQLENFRHGTSYSADNVVIVAGAWCGVELVFEELASLPQGGFRPLRIATIGPTHYQLFQRPIEVLGADVIAFDFVNFEGSTPGSVDEITALLEYKPSVVFVTNPNNPIGEYFPPDLLRHLIERCLDLNVTVVIDEMQNFMASCEGGLRYGRWIQAPNVIRIDSFSKHFGLAEYRVGWVIAPADIIGDRYSGVIGRVRGFLGNAPRAANDVMLALIDSEICQDGPAAPSLSRRWQSLIRKELFIARVAAREPQITVLPRQGCFNLTIKVDGVGSDLQFARELMEVGTMFMPCEGYGYRAEDCVMRITFAERWSRIRHGMEALRNVLRNKPKEVSTF